MQRVLLLQLIIYISIYTQPTIAQSPDYHKFFGFCVGALGLFALSAQAAHKAHEKQIENIVDTTIKPVERKPKKTNFIAHATTLKKQAQIASDQAKQRQQKAVNFIKNLPKLKKQAQAKIAVDMDYTQQQINNTANRGLGLVRQTFEVKQADCQLKLGAKQRKWGRRNRRYIIHETEDGSSFAQGLAHDIQIIENVISASHGYQRSTKRVFYWWGASIALACAGAVGTGLAVSSLKGTGK